MHSNVHSRYRLSKSVNQEDSTSRDDSKEKGAGMEKEAGDKPFIVLIGGWIWVDTTVAVVAKSVEEAQEKALAEVTGDGEYWMHTYGFREDPVIVHVEEPADWGDLQLADQTHLLPVSEGEREKCEEQA